MPGHERRADRQVGVEREGPLVPGGRDELVLEVARRAAGRGLGAVAARLRGDAVGVVVRRELVDGGRDAAVKVLRDARGVVVISGCAVREVALELADVWDVRIRRLGIGGVGVVRVEGRHRPRGGRRGRDEAQRRIGVVDAVDRHRAHRARRNAQADLAGVVVRPADGEAVHLEVRVVQGQGVPLVDRAGEQVPQVGVPGVVARRVGVVAPSGAERAEVGPVAGNAGRRRQLAHRRKRPAEEAESGGESRRARLECLANHRIVP